MEKTTPYIFLMCCRIRIHTVGACETMESHVQVFVWRWEMGEGSKKRQKRVEVHGFQVISSCVMIFINLGNFFKWFLHFVESLQQFYRTNYNQKKKNCHSFRNSVLHTMISSYRKGESDCCQVERMYRGSVLHRRTGPRDRQNSSVCDINVQTFIHIRYCHSRIVQLFSPVNYIGIYKRYMKLAEFPSAGY